MRTSPVLPESLLQSPHARTTHYLKNDYIYLPDDLSIHMYILQAGVVKIGGYASSGKEVMFDCIFPNEFFGNLKYLKGDFFTEYAKALVDIEVVEINVNHFKNLVIEDIKVADWFHEISTLRWYRAESRLFHIASEKPLNRIRHLFPLLNEIILDSKQQTITLWKLLSYQDIADLSGLSRQSAARIVKSLFAENKSNDIKLS